MLPAHNSSATKIDPILSSANVAGEPAWVDVYRTVLNFRNVYVPSISSERSKSGNNALRSCCAIRLTLIIKDAPYRLQKTLRCD